jgi:hypothetical protein
VSRSGTAYGPGWDAHTAAVDHAALRRFPARLPLAASGDRSAPEEQLRIVLSALTRPGHMTRNPVAHVALDSPGDMAYLLQMLRMAGAHKETRHYWPAGRHLVGIGAVRDMQESQSR